MTRLAIKILLLGVLGVLAGCESAVMREGAPEGPERAFAGDSRGLPGGAPVRLDVEAPSEPLSADDAALSVFLDGEEAGIAGCFSSLELRAGVFPDGGGALPSDTRVFIRGAELAGPFRRRGTLVLYGSGRFFWEHPDPEDGESAGYLFDVTAGIDPAFVWGGDGLPSGNTANVFGEGKRLYLIPADGEGGEGEVSVRLTYDVVTGTDFSSADSCFFMTNVETFPLEWNFFSAGTENAFDMRIVLHPVSMTGGVAGWEQLIGGR